MANKRGRYPLLDLLRGLALLDMVLFHFLFDVYVLGGSKPDWPWQPQIMLWQRLGMWLFVLLGGMSCALMGEGARWLYGLRLQALGLLLYAVTLLFMPAETIRYGILTFFGSALWLTALLENGGRRLLSRVGPLGMVLCLAGAALLWPASRTVGLGGAVWWRWPDWLYTDGLALLGFHSSSFASADYAPLVPHVFVFWLGFYLLPLLRRHCEPLLELGECPPLLFIGRHTLLLYLLHQPLLLIVLAWAGIIEL